MLRSVLTRLYFFHLKYTGYINTRYWVKTLPVEGCPEDQTGLFMQYNGVRVDLSSDSPGIVLRLQHLLIESITRRFNSAINTCIFFADE